MPSASLFGSVDSNPSDPPVVIASVPVQPSNVRVAPVGHALPGGWNPALWFAQVRATAGVTAVENSHPSGPGQSVEGWKWTPHGFGELEASAALDASGAPLSLTCFAQGFDPADIQAAHWISTTLALCASAAFPGGEPQATESWVATQEQSELADLRVQPRSSVARSAAPSFGSATCWVEAFYVSGYGYSMELTVA